MGDNNGKHEPPAEAEKGQEKKEEKKPLEVEPNVGTSDPPTPPP